MRRLYKMFYLVLIFMFVSAIQVYALRVPNENTVDRIEESLDTDHPKLEMSTLLYELDNPRVKELVLDIMTFGYSHIGVTREEVEKMVSILEANKEDYMKARQALYDAGFNWIENGNKYHDAYRNYKAKVRYGTTFHLIEKYIDEGDIIGDIGCGDDKLGIIIVDNIKNTKVMGTDVVDYRDENHQPHKNVDFTLQDENGKIPLPDNSVDKVLFSAVFHHDTPEMTDKLLREARRIVRPGGSIVILEDVVLETVPPINNEQGLIDKLKKLTDRERKSVISIFDWHANHVVVGVPQIPMELNYQTEAEWENTFARAGLRIKNRDFVGVYKDKVHCNPHVVFELKIADQSVSDKMESVSISVDL